MADTPFHIQIVMYNNRQFTRSAFTNKHLRHNNHDKTDCISGVYLEYVGQHTSEFHLADAAEHVLHGLVAVLDVASYGCERLLQVQVTLAFALIIASLALLQTKHRKHHINLVKYMHSLLSKDILIIFVCHFHPPVNY